MAGVLSMLNNPIVTMAMVFGAVQLMRYLDLTNRRTLLLLRMAYLASQMLMLLFWTYIRASVKGAKRNGELVEVEEATVPFSSEPAKKKKMTVLEYDTIEAGKQIQQIILGTVIMMALHFWLGLVQPLFLQILLPWKSLVTQPLVQIYVFGYAATGPLKRPFRTPNPFTEFASEQTAEPNEPAAAVAAPEAPATAGAGGKKKGARKED